jgi:hypothetical protein
MIQDHFKTAAVRRSPIKISVKLEFDIAFSINVSTIKNDFQLRVRFSILEKIKFRE